MLLTRSASALRLAVAVVGSLACAGALAPAALAAPRGFHFYTPATGPARVTAWTERLSVSAHLELVRGGVVVARGDDDNVASDASNGDVEVARLAAGDILNLYGDGAVIATTTYDGLPAFGADACAGRSIFTGTRSAPVLHVDVYTWPYGTDPEDPRINFTDGNPFTVTLDRPLAAGQIVTAVTGRVDGLTEVVSQNTILVGGCAPSTLPPAPVTGPIAPTNAPAQPATVTVAATRAKLRSLDPARLGTKASIALPFTFSEPGTIRLRLTATTRKGKKTSEVLIGTGGTALAVAGKAIVTVRLTAAGRKLLKRSRTLNLTLTATLTPARAGASPQTSTTAVTLKRVKRKH